MLSRPRLLAVVLAAGLSRRMGSKNKLLLEVEGRTLVRRVVDAFFEAGFSKVLVVTGHESERVREELAESGVEFIHNAEFAKGMGGSIARAVAEIDSNEWDGFAVCPGDLPWLRASDVEKLVNAFAKEDGSLAVAPEYDGRRGHPVLFTATSIESMCGLEGNEGAKKLFKSGILPLKTMSLSGRGGIADIDSPEDL